MRRADRELRPAGHGELAARRRGITGPLSDPGRTTRRGKPQQWGQPGRTVTRAQAVEALRDDPEIVALRATVSEMLVERRQRYGSRYLDAFGPDLARQLRDFERRHPANTASVRNLSDARRVLDRLKGR